jgi:Zn-dependent membrane protease YugP
MILDSRYLIFMLPSFILMMAVQWYVQSAYRRWSQVPTRSRITGAEAAERIISVSGLDGVRIEGVKGNLTDHYDPGKKVLRLSEGVYTSNSVAALAISAHELGHAMQDNEDYFPLRLRSWLVPAVNIGSNLGWILIMVGIVIQVTQVAWLGVLVFSGGAVFSLATLPVEFNASARARKMLTDTGLITGPDEEIGVKNVLNAAAMTYVAALVTAVLQLLYWITVVMGMGGRRRD